MGGGRICSYHAEFGRSLSHTVNGVGTNFGVGSMADSGGWGSCHGEGKPAPPHQRLYNSVSEGTGALATPGYAHVKTEVRSFKFCIRIGFCFFFFKN